jgi:hypothetical protein
MEVERSIHIMDLPGGLPVSLSDSDGGEVTDGTGIRVRGTDFLPFNGWHASFG